MNDKAVEIFSGARVRGRPAQVLPRSTWTRVQKGSKAVFDGHGHEVGLDGELSDGEKLHRQAWPEPERQAMSRATAFADRFVACCLLLPAWPASSCAVACSRRPAGYAHRHLPFQRHPWQDRQLRQGGGHHRRRATNRRRRLLLLRRRQLHGQPDHRPVRAARRADAGAAQPPGPRPALPRQPRVRLSAWRTSSNFAARARFPFVSANIDAGAGGFPAAPARGSC
ncbi:MAG: hypothetical protein MZV49_13630 [Rhodopseudomonas palustris]|nr:hypothetical protein [Rhodopseudomonas palustris]